MDDHYGIGAVQEGFTHIEGEGLHLKMVRAYRRSDGRPVIEQPYGAVPLGPDLAQRVAAFLLWTPSD